ncbi:exonuclease SbcCD subunit D [Chloroflexota bacterium]
MVRLLHTADIHLGRKFTSLGDALGTKGKEQREQVRATFKKVVSLAREEKVDIMLIAGDLFDSNQPPQRDIQLALEQFNLLAGENIPVCLIPGTHDCFDSGSIYRKVNFPKECPNVTIFNEADWTVKEFSHLNITVYGRPNLSNRSYESPLQGLKRQTSSRFHIAMAHGSLNIGSTEPDDHVFTMEQIRNSGMDYIALGHWHRPYACSQKEVIVWYPGPPELISLDQLEPGQVLLVTVPDSGEPRVERRAVGLRRCDEMTIDLTSIVSLSQLRSTIAQGASPDLVRKVILKGLRNEDVDIEDLIQELSDKFFYLKIDDRSYSGIKEYEGEHLIIAKFVRLMKEHIESCEGENKKIAEQVLQLGVKLLEGKEVL